MLSCFAGVSVLTHTERRPEQISSFGCAYVPCSGCEWYLDMQVSQFLSMLEVDLHRGVGVGWGGGGGWISGCGCAYMYCVVACHSADVNGILACRCLSSYPRWKQTCTEASGADWTPCWDSACTLACLSAVLAPTSAVWWPPSSRGRR